MAQLFLVRCILLSGFFFNNVLVFKPLQTEIRPSGKGVCFRPKGESVTALFKKVDTNGCTGFFQSFDGTDKSQTGGRMTGGVRRSISTILARIGVSD